MKPSSTASWLSTGAAVLLAARAAWAGPISVSELNYCPATDPDDEFIELVNTGAATINLMGATFTSGVVYSFASGTLAPGDRVVICKDRSKFTARYGTIPNLASGTYSGRFADEGETVAFSLASGAEMFRFAYKPDGAWPSRANGLGSSLEPLNPAGDLSDPANWRSSTEYLGSPGRAGVGPLRRIAINEVLAHTDPPLEDAIEFKNLTSSPIDIGGWYLSNSRANPKKFRIPSPTIVPAGGYRVIYEYQFNSPFPPSGTTPFTFNSANGDEAVLLSADANGTPVYWMDAVSFEPSENGVSFGRYPDGTGPLVTLADLSFGSRIRRLDRPDLISEFRTGPGASNGLPMVGPIVFNRIQYRPATNADEFVEILNTTEYELPLFDPLYPMNTWRIRDGIDYDFPAGILLRAGERAIVSSIDPAQFRTKYSIPAATRIWGPYTNQLSNTGERIALYKPDPPQLPPHPDAGLVPYILVEEIHYSPDAPWPVAANGTGPALQRINPRTYGDDPANWTVDSAIPVPNLSFERRGPDLVLRWPAASAALSLESSASPTSNTWTELAAVAAGTTEFVVSPNASAQFYRLRRR